MLGCGTRDAAGWASADSKRRIDTLYNFLTTAVWNLSSHMRGAAAPQIATEPSAPARGASESAATATTNTVPLCVGILDPAHSTQAWASIDRSVADASRAGRL